VLKICLNYKRILTCDALFTNDNTIENLKLNLTIIIRYSSNIIFFIRVRTNKFIVNIFKYRYITYYTIDPSV